MEVTRAQYNELLDRIGQARQDRDVELELNFGAYGITPDGFKRVITALAAVKTAQRSEKSTQLDVMPWGARTPRLTIHGSESVDAVCSSGTLTGENMVAIQKTEATDAPLKLMSYGITINSRRETPIDDAKSIAAELNVVDKQFRLKQRISFEIGSFRVDCTATNMNRKAARDVMSSQLLTSVTNFEIEVELVDRSRKPAELAEGLLKLATIVYRNLESSPYTTSISTKDTVIAEYIALVSPYLTGKDKSRGKVTPMDAKADPRSYFVGPNLVALSWENVLEPAEGRASIQTGYTVTDKADGERHLLLVIHDGRCFIINNRFHVRFTGVTLSQDMAGTLLDGELIERFKLQREQAAEITVAAFMIFDAYFFRGDVITQLPLLSNSSKQASRLGFAAEFVQAVEKAKTSKDVHVQIRSKKFLHKEGKGIFSAVSEILDSNLTYETDGIIFTPADLPVGAAFMGETPRLFGRWNGAMKWKPPHQNTIDFLVRMSGDAILEGGATVRHAKLLVGAQSSPSVNPLAVLGNVGNSVKNRELGIYGEREFTDVLLSLVDGKPVCESGEQIAQNSVVEFGYTDSIWIPLRLRHDKTQIYQRTGSIAGAANDIVVANRVWESIIFPVTEKIIRGLEAPKYQDGTADLYYMRDVERSRLALRHMNNFHTLWVKGETLFQPLQKLGLASLLDMGCGRGGDLHRYANSGFKLVVGLDENEDNLLNPNDGAYARLQKMQSKQGQQVIFVIWDASQPFDGNYDAQIRNADLRDITRAVFGTVEKSQLRQGLAPFYNIVKKRFDAVSAQFMIHYCCGSIDKLRTFLDNVSKVLADGGIFFGTHMDGERVNELLSKSPEGTAKGTKGGKLIWSISKKYEEFDDEPSGNIGKEILVYVESINKLLPEYLVDFRLLTQELASRGLRLADGKMLSKMNIKKATGMFSDLFAELQSAKRAGKVKLSVLDDAISEMGEDEKRFSFLNRYFIFQKVPA